MFESFMAAQWGSAVQIMLGTRFLMRLLSIVGLALVQLGTATAFAVVPDDRIATDRPVLLEIADVVGTSVFQMEANGFRHQTAADVGGQTGTQREMSDTPCALKQM